MTRIEQRGTVYGHLANTAGILLLLVVAKAYSENEPFRGQCFRTGKFTRVLKDRILPNHVVDRRKVTCSLDCVLECLGQPTCLSFNYEDGENKDHFCELNNATAATTAELVNKSGYSYYDAGETPRTCASFPCFNGGKCIDPCTTNAQARTCICGPNTYGDRCQFRNAKDFDIEFMDKGHENLVELAVDRDNMTEFAVSVWFRTNADGDASSTMFSYTTATEAKELLFSCQGMQLCQLIVGGESRKVYTPPLYDNLWHHIAVLWEHGVGLWEVIIDGAVRGHGKALNKGHVIPGRGRLVLGKSQGNGQASSFVGLLSEFHWFNQRVTPAHAKLFSTICKFGIRGNVARWQDFMSGIRGNVLAKWPSTCSGVGLEATFALRFPSSVGGDYIEAPTFPSLTRFTLCLWVKTQKTKFALLSYVLPDESRGLWYRIIYSGILRLNIVECTYVLRNNNIDILTIKRSDNDERSDNDSTSVYHSVIVQCQYQESLRTSFNVPYISDNVWHHVCISWENVQGKVQCFLDGVLRKFVTEFCVGVTIPGRGLAIVGQHAKYINMAFTGQLSHLNMWSSVLHEGTIGALSKDRGSESGDVISWKLLLPRVQGTVEVTSTPRWDWKQEQGDYDLKFPRRNTTDYALQSDSLLTLHQVTVCLWMKTTDTGVLFSYAVAKQFNALYAYLSENSVFFNINAPPRRRHRMNTKFLRDGSWHHICFTWRNFDGQWCMYIDNNQTLCEAGFKTGEEITGGGIFIIGQKQDKLGSNFASSEAFVGELSQVNVWGTSYSPEVIALMFRSRGHWRGNAISWEFFKYDVKGDAQIIKPSSWIRNDKAADYDLFIASKTETDFARLDSMATLIEFTVCLWMKTSTSDAAVALFSYATTTKVDALVLRLVNTNMQMKINNDIASDDNVGSANLRDDTWHHLCETWENVNGTSCLFVDGEKAACSSDSAKGQHISGGGILVVGQHQNSYGGGFKSEEAFSGLLNQVNVWNRAHSGTSIREMSRDPGLWKGNVASWSQFRNDVKGGAKILAPSSCTTLAEANDYEFKFPSRTVTDYVMLAPPPSPPSLTSLTVSWWMKTADPGVLAPFSIVDDVAADVLGVMFKNSTALFYLVGDSRTFVLASPFRDDKWHHFCYTWRSSDGDWYFYVDGRQMTTGASFKTGSKVQVLSLTLGQEQDTYGGGFDAAQAFVGVLSGFNLWNDVYGASSIKGLAQGCGKHRGAVVAWADLRTKAQGGVEVTAPATCGSVGVSQSDYDIKFDKRSTSDYALFESMPTLKYLTACLWMKSTNSENRPLTIFSYSSASDNTDAMVMRTHNGILTVTMNNIAGGDFAAPTPNLLDGVWHHVCIKWARTDGVLSLLVDGILNSSQIYAKGQTIDGGGKFVLGQEQDTLGGGFDVNEMFDGLLSQVNVWDYRLDRKVIKAMSCGGWPWTGSAVSWRDFWNNVMGGAAVISPQSGAFSVPTTNQESDFDLFFRRRSTIDHALLFMPSSTLRALTICLWLKTASAGMMSLFSYATTTHHNALLGALSADDDYQFYVSTVAPNTITKEGSPNLRDYGWHHLCFTWENVDGRTCVLVDGVERQCVSQVSKGKLIVGDGTFVIGQDQDRQAGGFESDEAFVGYISRVNLWDGVIETEFIWEMSHGCGKWSGNVIAWRYSLMSLHGDVMAMYPSECTLPVATVMQRRDEYCKATFGQGLALFDRKKDQEGKIWRCYGSSSLKQVPYLRGFAFDELKLGGGLHSRNPELLTIQD